MDEIFHLATFIRTRRIIRITIIIVMAMIHIAKRIRNRRIEKPVKNMNYHTVNKQLQADIKARMKSYLRIHAASPNKFHQKQLFYPNKLVILSNLGKSSFNIICRCSNSQTKGWQTSLIRRNHEKRWKKHGDPHQSTSVCWLILAGNIRVLPVCKLVRCRVGVKSECKLV